MQMTPMISATDVSGVFALLALISDPEGAKRRLLEIQEAQDKLASQLETVQQNRVDAESARKGSEDLLAEVDQKMTALEIREKNLAAQIASANAVVTRAKEDAAAILSQARADEKAIREATQNFVDADFARSKAVSEGLRLLKEQSRDAEARLANANAAMEALRAQVVGSVVP
jgi:chromosome segregation ATPase